MPGRFSHSATAVGASVYVYGGVGDHVHGDLWHISFAGYSGASVPCMAAVGGLASDSKAWTGAMQRAVRGPALAVTAEGLHCEHGQADGLPTHMVLRRMRKAGDAPIARHGHTALVLQQRLVVMGGYGAGSQASGDWMQDRRHAGVRSLDDAAVLDVGLPRVTRVDPTAHETSFLNLTATSTTESGNSNEIDSARPGVQADDSRLWVYGRGLGACDEWALVDGINRCVAGCREY